MIATRCDPGRANNFVANAETAAVRISVIAEALSTACNTPVTPSWLIWI